MTPTGGRPRLTGDEHRAIKAALAHASRYDGAIQAQLATHLLDTNVVDVAELRSAARRHDWHCVCHCVHRIKGGAALARCATLVAAGKSIESAAGQGNGAVVKALIPRFVSIVAEFNETLTALLSPASRVQEV